MCSVYNYMNFNEWNKELTVNSRPTRMARKVSCRWESHLFHMPGVSMYYVYITLRPDRIRSILANTRNNVAMTILRFESDEIIEVLVKSNMPFPFVETTWNTHRPNAESVHLILSFVASDCFGPSSKRSILASIRNFAMTKLGFGSHQIIEAVVHLFL